VPHLSPELAERGCKKHLTKPKRRPNNLMDKGSTEGERGIIICISGMTGCGKSTLAKQIAERYRLQYLSGGDALKTLAVKVGYKAAKKGWWESAEGMKFLDQRTQDVDFDRKVDRKLVEMAEKGNVVLDSWTMPWLLNQGFKVWLDASREVRVERLAGRDSISLERALEVMKEKEEKTKAIYKNLYDFDLGKDFTPFNLILDTDQLNADEILCALSMVIDRVILKRPCKQACG
jgi:cytidylate kinase